MSYTPTTWTTGDTITASALNKIEQGIADGGSGALIVTVTEVNSSLTMDKTFAEIYTALVNNTPCYMDCHTSIPSDLDSQYTYNIMFAPITKAYKYDTDYVIAVSFADTAYLSSTPNVTHPLTLSFHTSQASGYPTFFRKTFVNSSSLTVSSAWDL